MWDCEHCGTTNIAGSLEVCPHCQTDRYPQDVATEPGQPADETSSTLGGGDPGGAGLEPSPPGASAAASSSPSTTTQKGAW